MSTLTKEWLLKTIAELEEERDATPGAVNEDAAMALAAMKLALASLEAEPVYQVLVDGSWTDYEKQHLEELLEAKPSTLFRVAYPSPRIMNPVSVDADDNFYSWFGREWHEHYQHNQYTTAAKQMLGVMAESAWKAGRRAAMLQGAENVESLPGIKPAPALDSVDKNPDSPPGINQGKSEPVTTAYKLREGWVAVPVEPTEDMIVNGFESEPDESFSDEKEWEAYDAMSGCQQAAHRARLCWSAMIASRPKLKHDLT
ncbi:hypothetical protein [Enterobacter hormaechei]|uniref:hypothetical protein n=1 Tax=Enterobacter hormaechei TaxID=158836 RepID=UPI003F56D355